MHVESGKLIVIAAQIFQSGFTALHVKSGKLIAAAGQLGDFTRKLYRRAVCVQVGFDTAFEFRFGTAFYRNGSAVVGCDRNFNAKLIGTESKFGRPGPYAFVRTVAVVVARAFACGHTEQRQRQSERKKCFYRVFHKTTSFLLIDTGQFRYPFA